MGHNSWAKRIGFEKDADIFDMKRCINRSFRQSESCSIVKILKVLGYVVKTISLTTVHGTNFK